MSENNASQGRKEQPILGLIQDIKNGTVRPETLTKDLRQCCAEILLGEGYTVAAMAHVFNRSDKTIKRDLEEIRERNAITPDVDLAKKIIGELLMYGRIHRDHLMRLARNTEASVSEKSNAEYLASKVSLETIAKLQLLGYLPTVPTKIVGDFYQNVSSDKKRELTSKEREVMDEIGLLPARDRDRMAKRLERKLLELSKGEEEKEQR